MPKMAYSMSVKTVIFPVNVFFRLHKCMSMLYLLQMGRNGEYSMLKLVYRLHILYELYR